MLMLRTTRFISLNSKPVFALIAMFVLVACGGGGGDNNTPPPAPPGTNIYYVSSTAVDDTGDGLTPATAKRTINAAIDAAAANTPAEVRVSEGIYTVDSTPGIDSDIALRERVSLYGGYSADFSMRNTDLYTSTITDIGSGGTPNAAIKSLAGITRATIVDGFTVNGSATGIYSSSGVSLLQNSSPTIRNCNINGGGPTNGVSSSQSFGIYISGGSPAIEYNTISGGTHNTSYGIIDKSTSTIRFNTINGGNTGEYTTGILSDSSMSDIHNNLINGGSASITSVGITNGNSTITLHKNIISGGVASNQTYGLRNAANSTAIVTNNVIGGGASSLSTIIQNGDSNSNITVRNNILYAGVSTLRTYGVINDTSGTFILENNILYSAPGINGIGIVEATNLASDFDSVKNNNIFGFSTIFSDYDSNCTGNGDGDGNSYSCTLAEMESLTDFSGGVSGNISVDPVFADINGADNNINTIDDNDWHFSLGSPMSVTAGGLNGIDEGWSFNSDMDDITRPATGSPWSIGAFEP